MVSRPGPGASGPQLKPSRQDDSYGPEGAQNDLDIIPALETCSTGLRQPLGLYCWRKGINRFDTLCWVLEQVHSPDWGSEAVDGVFPGLGENLTRLTERSCERTRLPLAHAPAAGSSSIKHPPLPPHMGQGRQAHAHRPFPGSVCHRCYKVWCRGLWSKRPKASLTCWPRSDRDASFSRWSPA